MRLGIVTGLAREAGCLRVFPAGVRPRVRCRGTGPQAAASAAAELLREGCDALLSFGVAGGLDADLQPGRVLVADAIVTGGGVLLATDVAWRERLLDCLKAESLIVEGRLAGSDRPLSTPAEKRDWAERMGARAVDMESHAVARAAGKAGAAFLAVRAIVDPADRPIPPWLATTIDGRGRPRLLRVAAGVASHPRDLGRLLQLAGEQSAALAALRHVALNAGPLFALA